MKFFRFKIAVIGAWLLAGCSHTPLELALELAGDNRQELVAAMESVRGDSLKEVAMERLIVASVNYHSYRSPGLDSLKRRLVKERMAGEELRGWKMTDLYGVPEARDIERLTADMLVENVNLAVDTWRSRPWAKHYTLDEFCQYVLPYRIADEPLENWRGDCLKAYSAAYDSLCSDVDDPVEAARLMLTHLRGKRVRTLPELSYPHLGATYLLENRLGYCRDHCDLALYVLRALGIPAATDFYRESPSYNSRHFWTAVIDTLHHVKEFNLGEKPATWDNPEQRKKGKVFRIAFSPYSDTEAGEDADPFFRNPLYRDASQEYGYDRSITVDAKNGERQMYLSVFNGREFKAIAMAPVKGGKATFGCLEDSVLYFPTRYNPDTRSQEPAGYPALTCGGNRAFAPEAAALDSVEITRKYPYRKSKLFLQNTVGTRIEFMDRNGRRVHTWCVDDTPSINIFRIDLPAGKRACKVRITSNPRKRLEIGELWADDMTSRKLPESARAFLSDGTGETDITATVTDGSWESCHVSAKNSAYAVVEFTEPVSRLYFVPRTDDNYIHPGDSYELFYHDGADGWKSLGRREATESRLEYAVPRNAVLWLRNHTRGKEERPFTLKEGKQMWW